MAPENCIRFSPHLAAESVEWITRALLDSLTDLSDQLSQQAPPLSSQLNLLIEKINADLQKHQTLSPIIFGGYFHLVEILSQSNEELASEVLNALCAHTSQQEFVICCDEFCKHSIESDIFTNCMLTESQQRYWTSCSPDEIQHAKNTIGSIVELIRQTHPQFHAEFTRLVSSIIVAKPNSQQFRFDGASSYHLWGLMMLAWDANKTTLEWIETLAHESSHIFLFGLIREQKLMHDYKLDQTFSSPLRTDKRPLEGIFHATFVSARMYHAVAHYKNHHAGLFDDNEIEQLLTDNSTSFNGGRSTLLENAELTSFGKQLLDDCTQIVNA